MGIIHLCARLTTQCSVCSNFSFRHYAIYLLSLLKPRVGLVKAFPSFLFFSHPHKPRVTVVGHHPPHRVSHTGDNATVFSQRLFKKLHINNNIYLHSKKSKAIIIKIFPFYRKAGTVGITLLLSFLSYGMDIFYMVTTWGQATLFRNNKKKSVWGIITWNESYVCSNSAVSI